MSLNYCFFFFFFPDFLCYFTESFAFTLFLQSKGGILAKACEYIQELRSSNLRLSDNVKEMERLSVDLELFRQQCEELKRENEILRQTLQQHGIVVPDLSPDSAS